MYLVFACWADSKLRDHFTPMNVHLCFNPFSHIKLLLSLHVNLPSRVLVPCWIKFKLHFRLNGIFEPLILYLCGGRNSEEIGRKVKKKCEGSLLLSFLILTRDTRANAFTFFSRTEHKPHKGTIVSLNVVPGLLTSFFATGSWSSIDERVNFLLSSELSCNFQDCIFKMVCMGRETEPKIGKITV